MEYWLSESIEQFCASIGLQDVDVSLTGRISMDFEHRGQFYLECGDTHVICSLVQCFEPYERLDKVTTALRVANARYGNPIFPVHVSLLDDLHLACSVRLPVRSVSVQSLGQSLDLLTQVHQQCA